MSKENDDKKEKAKRITVGASLTLSSSVIVIRIRREARKELDKLSKEQRQEVLDEAIKITKERGHPYDVTKEDVIEAKKRKEEVS